MNRNVSLVALVVASCAGTAAAGPFGAGNLVVMRVNNSNPTGSGAVFLDEFTRLGGAIGNTVTISAAGSNGVSLPSVTNHDRHLHLSGDGRYVTFGAYGAIPGLVDPSTLSAASTPRVAAIVDSLGGVDLSTRLSATYDATAFRSVYTTDGNSLWMSGDNGGNATTTGGLRYAARGSASSVNLSQVQVTGGTPNADNVRDALAYGGQLYDCSGSSSSIGKGVFKVGSGLPTSGSQALGPALNGNDGASASSFALLDLNPAVPGVDTLYSATSAVGEGIHKYVFDGISWSSRGVIGFVGIDQLIAAPNLDGSVSLFAANSTGVVAMTDAMPLSSMLSGTAGAYIITAPAGFTLGGIEFTPVPQPGGLVLLLGGIPLMAKRRRK